MIVDNIVKKEREKIQKFINEKKNQIFILCKKSYQKKEEIDSDIIVHRKLISEIDKMTENKYCTNAMINELFDEMDELNEKLDELRKESRRMLNEASGLDILSRDSLGKGALIGSVSIKGFKV